MDDCQNAQKGSTQSQAKQTPGSKSQSMSLKRSNKSQATGLGKLLRLCFQFSPTGFWGPEKCWQQIKRRQHAPKTWSRTNFYLPLTFEHDFKKIYGTCVQTVFVRGGFGVFGQQLQKRKLSVGVIRSKHPAPCWFKPTFPPPIPLDIETFFHIRWPLFALNKVDGSSPPHLICSRQ